ncbi:hypothetical protein [Alienimonas sp. DA493]|uniref:hypothetical protein n=1 Tax=Alienimonas sp. DA493 TaxID=3373605 RepID=UPI0037549AEC
MKFRTKDQGGGGGASTAAGTSTGRSGTTRPWRSSTAASCRSSIGKATLDGEAEVADPDRRAWEGLIRNVARTMDECAGNDTPENRRTWVMLNDLRNSYRALLDAGQPCGYTPERVESDPECMVIIDGCYPDGPPEVPPPWDIPIGRPSPAGLTVGGAVGRA